MPVTLVLGLFCPISRMEKSRSLLTPAGVGEVQERILYGPEGAGGSGMGAETL